MKTEYDFRGGTRGKYAPRVDRVMGRVVVIRHSRHGYDAACAALPGCHSQGETRAEALENIKDAIRTYLKMVKIKA